MMRTLKYLGHEVKPLSIGEVILRFMIALGPRDGVNDVSTSLFWVKV